MNEIIFTKTFIAFIFRSLFELFFTAICLFVDERIGVFCVLMIPVDILITFFCNF